MNVHWFADHLPGLIDSIPLVATVVTTVLTIVLARATLRYAQAADRSVALAKISVLIQLVQLRRLSHAVPFERVFLNEPLVGGMTWTQSFQKRLITATGEDFQGPIAASVTFYASGRMFRTDWFRFQVTVRDGKILQLEPVNVSARRVQALELHEEVENAEELELVRDVAELSAPAAAGK
jgi:hypothetical protein